MCGIFGAISENKINKNDVQKLAKHSQQRGVDSSGLIYFGEAGYKVRRVDFKLQNLLKRVDLSGATVVFGHSRLITNGVTDNQPVIRNGIGVMHNGIIVNEKDIWPKIKSSKKLQIDSEVIIAIAEQCLSENMPIENIADKVLSLCNGVVACALALTKHGKLLLFSNNGSLYKGENSKGVYFASEQYPLELLGCEGITQIKELVILEIPKSEDEIEVISEPGIVRNLVPELTFNKKEEQLLFYPKPELKRCVKCILPESMPFINFDEKGVCNYCHHYKPRNKPKPKAELFELVEPYRSKKGATDCIVPFSGGRDSCYSLHLIVNELKMKPVTYTYDWGMVTDLGRRNISRMCSGLGVENIIIAADISKKRKNIAMNLKAWLKSPHLGMLSMLTAGDKHFFKYVEVVKKQTGINLNLWGINPLEVTHFKTGFLGIDPDFDGRLVYTSGAMKQLRYQYHRLKAMLESPGYFNSSLWDTLSGEYYRSFTEKKDYYHVFDYWRWDEDEINNTLINQYNWETAIDTSTTWRIGDGTASFYNYVYYTVAGFTEHDTFRSNQIREGQVTREQALDLVEDENKPRYSNIKWYLDTLGLDFESVIKTVNSIPKMYNK